MARFFALILAGFACLPGLGLADVVTGSATYRERIALTPDAVFEAILQDISRADAPAVELGRVTRPNPGNPPFDFEIAYDPALINPAHTYSVRTQITGSRGLMFVTDTVAPVLTRGAPDQVDLVMVRAGGATAPVAGALQLPASFTGTLPCADCAGIAHHLDLWADQSFQLTRTWLGRDAPLREDVMGSWSVDPTSGALVLHGTGDPALQWQITGPASLRALAQDGSSIVSDLPYDLVSDGRFAPADMTLGMTGEFVYFADSALFTECRTGQRFPVSMEGAYLALERTYLAARLEPMAPLVVVIDGQIALRPAMEGPDRRSVVVDRLLHVVPGESCAQNRAEADLMNTYWRIDRLGDEAITAAPDSREPHLILRGAGVDSDGPRYAATVGCNQVMGGIDRGPGGLRFEQGMTTLMACPPPLDRWEVALTAALEATRSYRIIGQTLLLMDDAGDALAVLRAVHLP